MAENPDEGYLNESRAAPVDWEPDTTGPARPRHVRAAQSSEPPDAGGQPGDHPERWRRVRAVVDGAVRASPYLGAASWATAAATTDWDEDGHGDIIDIGTFDE